jgi:chaperone BCS1
MTTNHKEKLDPALLRPGRTDFNANLNNASYCQMVSMFKRFNPENFDRAHEFAKQLPENKLSLAKLQGHLMKYRN